MDVAILDVATLSKIIYYWVGEPYMNSSKLYKKLKWEQKLNWFVDEGFTAVKRRERESFETFRLKL